MLYYNKQQAIIIIAFVGFFAIIAVVATIPTQIFLSIVIFFVIL